MNVYVLCRGERGEGHDPERVFATLAAAKWFAQEKWRVEPHMVNALSWMATWNGVDEVWIFKLKVTE